MVVGDKVLVEQVCQGNMDAFAVLTSRYSNAVYATAFSTVGDFHLAQDISQESFVKAWYKIHTLENKERFGSWLYAITKRISFDWLKKKDVPVEYSRVEQLVDPIPIDEMVEALERKRQVWTALNTLDEKYREVTVMYFISGFNVREISKYLNISVSSAESRLRRSKDKLKKELSSLIEETLMQNRLDEEFERKVIERLQGVVVVYIPAINLKESAVWYEKYLGYKITHMGDIWSLEKPGYLKIILSEIGCDTHPIQFSKPVDKSAVMMIGTPDIDDYHHFLKQKGVEVTNILDRGVCGRSFQMQDPAGNQIIVDAFQL